MTAVAAPPSTVEVRQRPEPRGASTDPAGTVALTHADRSSPRSACAACSPTGATCGHVLIVVIGVHAAAAVMRFAPRARRGSPCRSCCWSASCCCRSSTTATPPTSCCRPGETIDVHRAPTCASCGASSPAPSPRCRATAASPWPPPRCWRAAPCSPTRSPSAPTAGPRPSSPPVWCSCSPSALGHRPQPGASCRRCGSARRSSSIAVLRFSHARDDAAWMGAGPAHDRVGAPGHAGVRHRRRRRAPVLLAPRLPGATQQRAVRHAQPGQRRHPGAQPARRHPLAAVNRANVEVFTVQASTAAYWREIALDELRRHPVDAAPRASRCASPRAS